MSEPAANPSLPIPNHDPRCRCELEPAGVPEATTVITGGSPGQPEARVALHADCPHHGPAAGQIAKGASGYGISYGFGGPAASEAAQLAGFAAVPGRITVAGLFADSPKIGDSLPDSMRLDTEEDRGRAIGEASRRIDEFLDHPETGIRRERPERPDGRGPDA